MGQVSDGMKAFFAEFERANNAFAAELLAPLVGDPLVGADPGGAMQVVKKEDYLAGVAGSREYLQSLGFQFVKLVPVEELPLNPLYTMVKVHGTMHLEKIAGQPIDLIHDTVYILFVGDGSPRICFTLTHEDPLKMAQDQGFFG
jgi:hypothetical protein